MKMDAEAAMQKARKMKAETFGIYWHYSSESDNHLAHIE